MRSDYLLDTSVLSELAPDRPPLSSKVDAWILVNQHRFHASIISVAEVAAGIAKLRREKAVARANAYEIWLSGMLSLLEGRLLAFDLPVARRTGELIDLARSKGHNPGFADIAIAASAEINGLTVLTRNSKHFEALKAAHLDPFTSLPR